VRSGLSRATKGLPRFARRSASSMGVLGSHTGFAPLFDLKNVRIRFNGMRSALISSIRSDYSGSSAANARASLAGVMITLCHAAKGPANLRCEYPKGREESGFPGEPAKKGENPGGAQKNRRAAVQVTAITIQDSDTHQPENAQMHTRRF